MTNVYSNQTHKKSISNEIVADAPPIVVEGVEYYYCGTTLRDAEIGATVFRNKVLRAFTAMQETVVDGLSITERIVLVG